MNKLSGKVAIVTGASRGIGAAIAKALAAAGASITVNYASSKEEAEAVAADITQNGSKAIVIQGDMSNANDVKKLFQETQKTFGKLDILVNNAGYFFFEPLEKFTEAAFHKHYNINVLGPFLTIVESLQYFGPEGGSIINISSIVSTHPNPDAIIYSSTKAALDNMTRSIALVLGTKNIRVNAVNPGYTLTDSVKAQGIAEGEEGKNALDATPLGRFGLPMDIAPTVLFLASDDSAWITGETIRAAGGLI